MRATVYQHPRSAVTFDPPRDPRDPIVVERLMDGYPPDLVVSERPRFEELTEDQIALLDAVEVLERLADRLGSYSRVQNVLKTVAMIHGEAL